MTTKLKRPTEMSLYRLELLAVENTAKGDHVKRMIIGALQNLGGEHLIEQQGVIKRTPKWKVHLNALYSYLEALICEYGEDEHTAHNNLIDEIYHVSDCVDNVSLEWTKEEKRRYRINGE